MACCCGTGLSETERAAIAESSKLDRVLGSAGADDSKVIKLLLLGTGESGKSTIFKQMQILYQSGFTDFERQTFRHVVRRNIVEAMQTLIHGCEKFGLALSSEGVSRAATFLIDLDPLAGENEFWTQEIVQFVQQLWREPSIQEAFANRAKLQLLDSAQYLFENVERIGAPDYTPSPDDILRARLRTSGIVERVIRINRVDFRFMDVGGQRNERRKWIHCFEGVTAVIFVAAISEYDQVLYEDEKENRLHEAISVFANICNNKYFASTSMILFLNKIDLFREKIKRVPLRTCFPEYTGGNAEDECKAFVRQKFLDVKQNKNKMVFVHFTCATDTNQVQQVFDACKATILKENLEKLGLG